MRITLLIIYFGINLRVGYSKEEWLSPIYLVADFNGDQILDTAFAYVDNEMKGIRIVHGNIGEVFILGAGVDFGNGGSDFSWVDYWRLVTDKKTFEITFLENGDVDGSREVILDNTSFYIGAQEAGGAVITWKNGKYIWIHQSC